ncbi:MAG TPA: hypothetical protein VI953_00445 [Candidatus Paceibacterota bacterium]
MRIAERKKIVKKITFVVWALTFFVFGTFLLTSNRFRIHTVTISGDEQNAFTTRDVVESNLAGVYFGLVPKDNLFVYPESAIATNLYTINPGISKVEFIRKLGGELIVSLALHGKDYIWCVSEESLECRFLDEEGQAYATSSPVDGKFEIVSGEHLSKEVFVNVRGVLLGLASSSFATRVVKVNADDIVYNVVEGWYLRTSVDASAGEVMQRVKGAFTTEALKDAKARAKLDYLDVRLDNKMFYKFK